MIIALPCCGRTTEVPDVNVRRHRENMDRNRYRGAYQIKYVILGVLLVLAYYLVR